MYREIAPSGHSRSWQPDELGLPKATGLSVLLVTLIAGFCLFAATVLAPKPQPQPIQITQATLTQLPRPTPPPPPKIVPPPKPLPAVIPKPPPVPSKIVVATKPPPPVHHIFKPVPHPAVTHQPAPPVPTPQPAPPQPAAPRTDGVPIYGAQMHAILQANQNVPAALAQLGISGTAYVEITVAPDGHVVSARIAKSSGNKLIDQTALDHALRANFGVFNANMPAANTNFVVPVEIEPDPNQ